MPNQTTESTPESTPETATTGEESGTPEVIESEPAPEPVSEEVLQTEPAHEPVPKKKLHRYATVFPEMTPLEFETLREDIRVNDLHEKILLFKGKVADGRHRYRAIRELKLDGNLEHYVDFDGTEEQLLERVMSNNIRRRHLSESQRAMIASELSKKEEEDGTEISVPVFLQGNLAELFNISEDLIQFANTVNRSKDKKLIDAVFNGDMAVSKARNEVKRREKANKAQVHPPRMSAEYIKQQGITLTRLPALGLLDAIDDGAIDCCIADPPYNSGITGWDCNFDPLPFLKELGRVLKKGGSALIFCNDVLLPDYISNSVIGHPPTDAELKSAKKLLSACAEKTTGVPAIKKLIVAERKAKKAYEDAEKHSYDENAKEGIEIAKTAWDTAKANLKEDRAVYTLIKAYYKAEAVCKTLKEKQEREEAKPLVLHQILHWQKRNNQDQQLSNKNKFLASVEYILWFTKGEKHTFNRLATYGFKDLFDGTNRVTDVISTNILAASYASTEGNRHSKNESLKPFRLIELLVKVCSNPKDIILDCYHGKGVTALVSFLANRSCITSELDPRKVYGVQEWRLTDMFQFVAQDTNLIDRKVPITLEQLNKIEVIADIIEIHEYKGEDIVMTIDGVVTTITAQDQLEQWRDFYIYNKFIWSVIAKHPEFKIQRKDKNPDLNQTLLTAKRKEIWDAEGLWDDNYYFEPEGLKRDIFPMDNWCNFKELIDLHQHIDPYDRPLNDPLRIAYKNELKPLEESDFNVEYSDKKPDGLTYKQLNDVRKYLDWTHQIIIDGAEVIFNVLPVGQFGVGQHGFERVGGAWTLEEYGRKCAEAQEEREARLAELGLAPDVNEMSIRALQTVFNSDKYIADHKAFHGYDHPLAQELTKGAGLKTKVKPEQPAEAPVKLKKKSAKTVTTEQPTKAPAEPPKNRKKLTEAVETPTEVPAE